MKNRVLPIWIGILIFIVAFLFGMISKFLFKPSWMKEYSVKWSDEIGVRITDIPYGEGELNKFDLYLPKDSSKDNYGLIFMQEALLLEIKLETKKCYLGYVVKAMLLQA